jgi:hypothetical protein
MTNEMKQVAHSKDYAKPGQFKPAFPLNEETVVTTPDKGNDASHDDQSTMDKIKEVFNTRMNISTKRFIGGNTTGSTAVAGNTTNTKERSFMDKFKSVAGKAWDVAVAGTKKVGSFFKKHASTMGITVASVVVGGAVTSSAVAAVGVGASISTAILLCKAFLNKDKKMSSKDLLISAGVVAVTAASVPCLFYTAAVASILSTVLPYAVIVA